MYKHFFTKAPQAKDTIELIVGIPVYQEYNFIFSTIQSLKKNNPNILKKTLCVLLINNKQKDLQEKSIAYQDNKKLWQEKNSFKDKNLSFLIIDAFSSKKICFKDKQGVGLARAEAFSQAYPYCKNKNPLCLWLDADTIVPPEYLTTIEREMEKIPIAHCQFKHQKAENDNLQKAINQYENFMHHYVKGLKEAGSSYAYHSIGSTIVCQWNVFNKCKEVIKKRLAGEDFYFLQHACKIFGSIQQLSVYVFPSARLSNRTPFGTGTKIKKLSEKVQSIHYSQRAFNDLKNILQLLKEKKASISKQDFHQKGLQDFIPFFEKIKFFNHIQKWKTQLRKSSILQDKFINEFFDAFNQQKFLKFAAKK